MKISPSWLREFSSHLPADDRKLADDLTAAGITVEKVSGSIFEMEITTNRVDAMNHYGIAREASAIYDTDLKPLTANLPKPSGKSDVKVTIQAPDHCARFTGQEIRNVKIGPSSALVATRFAELEQKPINNAADATNYVMLTMGKPTHAFDLDKLAGRQIIVRLAKPGETLKTLDGVERKLHPEDLVIADAAKPVGLAGTIGGWDTMITETTRNVFIESAWFEPATVRKMSRRHGIHTDASHRFERGADWATTTISTDLVAQHILDSGGGELVGEKIDVVARQVGNPPVTLRLSEVKRILGKDIAQKEIERILRRLGFTLSASGSSAYKVAIPTWRLDVEREVDLIEEIARVHGYNNFPNTLPSFSGGVVELPEAPKEEKLRRTLLALGYNEALSSTFIAKADSLRFASATPVEIANPLSEEASAMRTTLVPGMLAMIAHNLNRDVEDVRLFEMGHVYSMQSSSTDEHDSLTFAHTAASLGVKDPAVAFRTLKGDVEQLLSAFAGKLSFSTKAPEHFHPGRSATAALDGKTMAVFGQLAPAIASERKLKQDIYIAEVALDKLFALPLRKPRYQKLSRFPAVDRDFSFLFDDSVTWAQIQSAIESLRILELRSIVPAEVFRGGNVPAGKYSILIRVEFQSNDRTLTDTEVGSWSERIIHELAPLGGTLRAQK
jgi:phenylalanyl-tRNA synthetase beta chain